MSSKNNKSLDEFCKDHLHRMALETGTDPDDEASTSSHPQTKSNSKSELRIKAGSSRRHKKSEIQVHELSDSPNHAWDELLKAGTVCKKVPAIALDTPRKEGYIRFVCISDTHGRMGNMKDRLPAGDVLIHAGDFTKIGDRKEVEQFNAELATLNYKHKIVIAGNHELSFSASAGRPYLNRIKQSYADAKIKDPRSLLTNCTYLEDQQCDVFGYKIYGSPWQPEFHGWAFNVRRGIQLLEIWDKIPKDTEILVTHGPPIGHGDFAINGCRAGCVELLTTVEQRVHPLVHVFGHIHEGHGVTTNNQTLFINAAICDVSYKPRLDPIIFDLPVKIGT